MEYMHKDEIDWGKRNGLKRTSLRTASAPCGRVVYRARDGRLFYRDHNFWQGTFVEYCYDTEQEGTK